MKVQNDLRAPGNDKAQSAAIRKVKNDKVEWQIAKVGIMLTVLFCASWMPYASVAFIGEFIDHTLVTPMVQVIPVVLAKSSACWNPLVYAISHQRFKEALRNRFFNYCCGGMESQRHLSEARSTSSGNRHMTDSRTTCLRSVISEQDTKRERNDTVTSTVTSRPTDIELTSQHQRPLRSSLKGGRRQNDNDDNKNTKSEQRRSSLPDTSTSVTDTGNVNLVMASKSKDGVAVQDPYVAYDNPAAILNEKDELTKLWRDKARTEETALVQEAIV